MWLKACHEFRKFLNIEKFHSSLVTNKAVCALLDMVGKEREGLMYYEEDFELLNVVQGI